MTEKPNLKEHLLGGPKDEEFEIPRELDTGRTIRLWTDDDAPITVDSPNLMPPPKRC